MKVGELAYQLGLSRGHTWRLASAKIVPGTKRTKGGHFYFVEGKALSLWIRKMESYKFRKGQLSKAYQNHYGSNKTFNRLKLRRHLKHFRKAARRAGSFSKRELLDMDMDDYYFIFHQSVHQLEMILNDWDGFSKECVNEWPMEINEKMRSRLISFEKKLKAYMHPSFPPA